MIKPKEGIGESAIKSSDEELKRIKTQANLKKKELITLQKDDATDEKITFAQNKLDDAYSQFYIRHGHINKPVNEI